MHDATTFQTNEATAVRQRRRAMGHNYQRVVMGDGSQRLDDFAFGVTIKSRRGFIQHDDLGVAIQRTRNAQPLTLAA